MAIFGFWPKNGAKIGAIIKNQHFSFEFNILLGKVFGMSKLCYECIFGNLGHIQGALLSADALKYCVIIKCKC